MPTLPLVTIAIPTYNRASGYLGETLGCALGQTYPHLDIIVCDNCSPDHTEAYVRSVADPRLRYFRHEPGLLPNDNFNFGLQQARGEYFLLLHDDDLIDADFVESCVRAVRERGPAGLIRTGARRIDGHGAVLLEVPNEAGGLPMGDFMLAWLASRSVPMYLCNSLFNTAHLLKIGGFRSRHNLFQDALAELTVAARFGRIDVKEIKASYRVHASQRARGALVWAWCEDSQQLLDAMCALAPAQAETIRQYGRWFFSVHNYRLAALVPPGPERWRAQWQVFRAFDLPGGYTFNRWLRPLRALKHRFVDGMRGESAYA